MVIQRTVASTLECAPGAPTASVPGAPRDDSNTDLCALPGASDPEGLKWGSKAASPTS